MRAGGGNFDITTIYFDSLNYIRLRRFIRCIKRSFLRVAAVYSSKYGPVIAPRLTIRDEGFIECLIGAIWSDLDSFPARQFRRPTRSTRIRYRSSNDISREFITVHVTFLLSILLLLVFHYIRVEFIKSRTIYSREILKKRIIQIKVTFLSLFFYRMKCE